MSVTLNPVFVDLDEGCKGVQQPVSFARTMQDLENLTIDGSELVFTAGAELITVTVPWTPVTLTENGQSVPGGYWYMRGLSAGPVAGEILLRLSDGQHIILPFSFEVKDP